MILTRTPYRISFFGGGTDYPAWHNHHPGAVLSTTIDKYCNVLCRPFPPYFEGGHTRVVWSKIELVGNVMDIEHPAVRGAMQFLNIRQGIEVHHLGDLPARSGLGAGSSFVVGILQALSALSSKETSPHSLALDAIHVERDVMGESVGSQDQVAAAYGGFNRIDFSSNDKIVVEPLAVPRATLDEFEKHLMLFFTGTSRSASDVAAAQIKNISSHEKELSVMYGMVGEAISLFKRNDLDAVGRLLHSSWQLKQALSPIISNDHINDIYKAGMNAGALGGKLLGAGAGGFVLFYAPPKIQPKIRERLRHLLCVPFHFTREGSRIMYQEKTETA